MTPFNALAFIDNLPTNTLLDNLSLVELLQYVHPSDQQQFLLRAGKDHYRLLSYLSTLVSDAVIYDIGTNRGSSAIALSNNKSNVVVSLDIVDKRGPISSPNNVQFFIHNILSDDKFVYPDFRQSMEPFLCDIYSAPFICFDIDPHDGLLEATFHQMLLNKGYKGVVFYDDIHLSPAMQKFWDSIPPSSKLDLTHIGHGDFGAGSGLVFYDAPTLPKWKKLSDVKPYEVDANGRPYNHVD